jgi:hypothetical protein
LRLYFYVHLWKITIGLFCYSNLAFVFNDFLYLDVSLKFSSHLYMCDCTSFPHSASLPWVSVVPLTLVSHTPVLECLYHLFLGLNLLFLDWSFSFSLSFDSFLLFIYLPVALVFELRALCLLGDLSYVPALLALFLNSFVFVPRLV